jgi:hypothetical protein
METPGDPLLELVANLARFHREHEKFYAEAPLHDAITLQRASRALKALAERWAATEPSDTALGSPYAGAPDLNDERAIETLGILFMEGEGEPAEIARLKRDLRSMAEGNRDVGRWLAEAMERSWAVAAALIERPELADLLGERHRIISNDWQNAATASIIGHVLDRAADVLDAIDFSPGALRDDLGAERRDPALLLSACELIDHAADLAARSATLTHDNDRRWRAFHARVAGLVDRGRGPRPRGAPV